MFEVIYGSYSQNIVARKACFASAQTAYNYARHSGGGTPDFFCLVFDWSPCVINGRNHVPRLVYSQYNDPSGG